MGNYEDHVRYGHIAYALLAIALAGAITSGGLPIELGVPLAILAYPFTRLGAAFPDIDHHASHPHKTLLRLTFILGTLTTFGILYTQPVISFGLLATHTPLPIQPETTHALFAHTLSFGGGLLSQKGIKYFRPTHRGITHKHATGLALSVLIAAVVWYPTSQIAAVDAIPTAVILSSAFFVGFLSHLACDRMLVPDFSRPSLPSL